MSKKVSIAGLPTFDAAEYLDDDVATAEYLSIVLEENDTDALVDALGTIARARGMTEVARASGVTREALYRALRHGAHPRIDTVQRVVAGLGLRLTAQPA